VVAVSFEAARQSLLAAKQTLDAVSAGINVDPTASADRPYSGQRADDVLLRLGERRSQVDAAQRLEKTLTQALEAEKVRVSLKRDATLRSLGRARISKLFVGQGEYVMQGKELVELRDCDRLVVTAAVPESKLNRIRIGTSATVLLAGVKTSYDGTVINISGVLSAWEAGGPGQSLTGVLDRKFDPTVDRYYGVVVSAPRLTEALAGVCEIGQTVEVTFHPQ
jgi:multidrug resistance efflux pump